MWGPEHFTPEGICVPRYHFLSITISTTASLPPGPTRAEVKQKALVCIFHIDFLNKVKAVFLNTYCISGKDFKSAEKPGFSFSFSNSCTMILNDGLDYQTRSHEIFTIRHKEETPEILWLR